MSSIRKRSTIADKSGLLLPQQLSRLFPRPIPDSTESRESPVKRFGLKCLCRGNKGIVDRKYWKPKQKPPGAPRLLQFRRLLRATYAKILKAQRFHPWAIEQVLGIHNYGVANDAADAVEIQRAELRPTGAQDQRVSAFRY